MKRVIITGGSGFIGTNLIECYAKKGWKILNLDILAPRNINQKKFWKKFDVCDTPSLKKILNEFSPSLIFHLAARTDLDGSDLEAYRVNVDGVSSLIEAAKMSPSIKRIIFASSMLVCKLGYNPVSDLDFCPVSFYGKSKVAGEKLVRRSIGNEFEWVIVRPTSIWGPWFSAPYKNFFYAVSRGYYFHPKGLKTYRNYGFILNVVFQLEKIGETLNSSDANKKVFYLGDFENLEIYDWSKLIAREFGVRAPLAVNVGFLRVLALIGDFLKFFGITRFPINSIRLSNLMTSSQFSMSPLETLIGPLPFSLHEGVRITVQWMRRFITKVS